MPGRVAIVCMHVDITPLRWADGPHMPHRVGGQGPLLVLAHGFMVTGDMFLPFWPYAVEAGYTVVVPDLRGVGRNRNLPGPNSITQQARDLLALMDAYGAEQAHVMGYSKGGLVAQELAWLAPERVQTLVLGCTFSHKPVTPLERLQQRLLDRALAQLGQKGLANLLSGDLTAGPLGLPRNLVPALKHMLAQNPDPALRLGAYELFAYDGRNRLPQLKPPTLVIAAGQDLLVPMHHTYELAGNIPRNRLRVFDEAGHGLIYSHAQEYAEVVLNFMAKPMTGPPKASVKDHLLTRL